MPAKKHHSTNPGALYFNERLISALACVGESPFTFVHAPMGYGKTIAVRELLRESGMKIIWTRVPEGGEIAFWREFCAALLHGLPHQAEAVETLLHMGYPTDAVLVEAACELLFSMDFGNDTVLVVDDIHMLVTDKTDLVSFSGGPAGKAERNMVWQEGVTSGGMGKLCELLAAKGKKGLHIVCISRYPYGGSGAFLRLHGRTRIVGSEVFALNPREIKAYFGSCGILLSSAQSRELFEQTGGWISALYLYVLRHGKNSGISRPEGVNTLLEQEVFAPLSAEAKDLLLAVCQTERFEKAQADFLYGGDASGLLAELRAKNSFLRYEVATESYAPHDIFRHFIRDRFRLLPPERQQLIFQKNADWFCASDNLLAAIEACYAAGDFDRALSILEGGLSRTVAVSNPHVFMNLFKECPKDILAQHLDASYRLALAALSLGDMRSFGATLAWINEQCAIKAKKLGEDHPQIRAWRGELETILSLAAYNDIAAMSVHHRKANELLGRPTRLFGPAPWTMGSPSVLYMFHRESGKLAEEQRLMHECLPHYYILSEGHGSGAEHMMDAEILFNAGDFENAAVACHRAQAMATAKDQFSIVLCALFLRARLALAEGDFDAAREIVLHMRDKLREKRTYFLLHTIELCEGYLHALPGLTDEIPDWLRGEGGEKRLYNFAGGTYYIVQGRILLLEGQYTALLGLFAWLLESGTFAKNLIAIIYTHIYMACAHYKLGKGKMAIEELAKALDLALPDNLYMPFVENFDLLEPLLWQVASGRVTPTGKANAGKKATLVKNSAFKDNALVVAGVETILRLAVSWQKNMRRIYVEHGELDKPLLTKRERELALLAAGGLQYKAIAEKLGLAPSTVKRAFATMYKKLGISGRNQLRAYLSEHEL